MHIAFVNLIIEHYSPVNGGAIATFIMQQAKRLTVRGHRVSVLTRVGDSPIYDIGEVVPVDVKERHEIAKPRRAWSKVLQQLNRWDWPYYEYYTGSVETQLKRLKPDAVVCFNDLRIPRYVRRALPDAKVWVRLSNEVWTNQRDPKGFDQAIDGYFTVSRYIRDWAGAEHGIDPERCVVLHNGCDPEVFSPKGPAESRSDTGPLRVLFVGRINHDKGPDLVVEAVRRLRDAGRPVQLTVAGSVWWNNDADAGGDPYFTDLKRAMAETNVRHLGHVVRADMPDLYLAHDVVVMPSRWQEPCGQVQMEAMASGCAVVVSDRGGLPETVGEAGVLIDPDTPGSIELALQSFLDDPAQLAERKRRSREQAERLTWDHNVDAFERALLGGDA